MGEDLLSLTQAARKFPPHCGEASHLNRATLFRWIVRGLRTKSGCVVKLESIKIGAGICTTEQALERFIVALNADGAEADSEATSQPVTSSAKVTAARKRASEADAKELERMGA